MKQTMKFHEDKLINLKSELSHKLKKLESLKKETELSLEKVNFLESKINLAKQKNLSNFDPDKIN